jgi:gas vesicle protein
MRAFLIGLGMGIGLGILFAPMSGEQTRNNIADRAGNLANSAKETRHGLRGCKSLTLRRYLPRNTRKAWKDS